MFLSVKYILDNCPFFCETNKNDFLLLRPVQFFKPSQMDLLIQFNCLFLEFILKPFFSTDHVVLCQQTICVVFDSRDWCCVYLLQSSQQKSWLSRLFLWLRQLELYACRQNALQQVAILGHNDSKCTQPHTYIICDCKIRKRNGSITLWMINIETKLIMEHQEHNRMYYLYPDWHSHVMVLFDSEGGLNWTPRSQSHKTPLRMKMMYCAHPFCWKQVAWHTFSSTMSKAQNYGRT